MSLIKVKNFDSLSRDIKSGAIVNTNKSEYSLYMNRLKLREQQSDKLRNACKEINTLKAELREIKNLLKKVVGK
jgi:hypothetical protein